MQPSHHQRQHDDHHVLTFSPLSHLFENLNHDLHSNHFGKTESVPNPFETVIINLGIMTKHCFEQCAKTLLRWVMDVLSAMEVYVNHDQPLKPTKSSVMWNLTFTMIRHIVYLSEKKTYVMFMLCIVYVSLSSYNVASIKV